MPFFFLNSKIYYIPTAVYPPSLPPFLLPALLFLFYPYSISPQKRGLPGTSTKHDKTSNNCTSHIPKGHTNRSKSQ